MSASRSEDAIAEMLTTDSIANAIRVAVAEAVESAIENALISLQKSMSFQVEMYRGIHMDCANKLAEENHRLKCEIALLRRQPMPERYKPEIHAPQARAVDYYEKFVKDKAASKEAAILDFKTSKGCAYFIQAGDSDTGSIKIGYSAYDTPHARLPQLQTANAETLFILGWMPGGAKKERELHEQFKHLRIGAGEWFKPGRDLLEYIEKNAVKPNGS